MPQAEHIIARLELSFRGYITHRQIAFCTPNFFENCILLSVADETLTSTRYLLGTSTAFEA